MINSPICENVALENVEHAHVARPFPESLACRNQDVRKVLRWGPLSQAERVDPMFNRAFRRKANEMSCIVQPSRHPKCRSI